MKETLIFSIFLIFSVVNANNYHGFHVSFCTVEFNTKNRNLEISLNLVLDDIEAKLEKEGAPKLNLCTEKEHEKGEFYLKEYLNQHFIVEINGEEKNWNWIGKEITEELDGVWCYFEISDIEDIKNLKITNDILMNELEDQKNILDIIGPNGKKGYLMFHKGYSSDSLEF